MNMGVAMREYLRPWKLITLSIGIAWLIWGTYYYQLSDWDLGVSLVMGFLTYFLAPVSARIIWERNWSQFPLAVFYGWLCVDGSYWLWHTLAGNEMLRADQWQTSLCLFLICGFLWLPKTDVATIAASLRQSLYSRS
jgi:cell shape-determining protein MreD